MTRLRVALFHPHLAAVGGAELLMLAQARALRGAGHAVEIVCFSCDAAAWAPRLDGMRAVSLDEPRWLRAVETAFAPSPRRLAFAERALAGADVVVAHNHPASSLAGQIAGKRAIWYCHEPPRLLYPRETEPHAFAIASLAPDATSLAKRMAVVRARTRVEAAIGSGPWERLRRFDRAGVAKLGQVWANGAFSRGSFARAYGRDCDATLTPMVVDPGAVPRRAGLRRPLRVLCQSRLAPEKNTEQALRGFARFASSEPGATLAVVGGGRALAHLRGLARTLGVERATRFLGHVSDDALALEYANADVFLAVPFDEPFGMVFVEAALRGLLVVATNHGGPVEIFDGGALAELVDPVDTRNIADGLSTLAAMSAGDLDARRDAAAAKMRAEYVTAVGEPRFVAALERACA